MQGHILLLVILTRDVFLESEDEKTGDIFL